MHDDFEDSLLDLIYDELPKERAAALRAHAATCEKCGASLAKLSSARTLARALPIEEPRAELTTAILARAREAMGARVEKARADAPAPRARPESADRSFWAALAARLGTFLVGPQAAMAVVTMLMVGIGLYYFPRLRSHHAVEGGRTVDPDPDHEAGPSAEISPAAPLDLRYDPRTRRIVDARGAPPPAPSRAVPTPTPGSANGDGDQGAALAQLDEVQAEAPATDSPTTPSANAVLEPQGGARPRNADDRAGRVVQDPLAAGDSFDGVATLDVQPGGSLGLNATGSTASGPGAGHGARGSAGGSGVADLEGQQRARTDTFRQQVAQLAPAENVDRYEGPAAEAGHAVPAAHHATMPAQAGTPATIQPAPPRDSLLAAAPPSAPRATVVRAAPPPPPVAPSGYAPTAPPQVAIAPERRVADDAFYGDARDTAPRAGGGTSAGSNAGLSASGAGSGGGGGGIDTSARMRAPTPDSTGVVARSPTNEPLAPLALHHRARTEAASAPQLAIRDYESLLARFPTYPESGAAMLELAELYRRTGEVGRARTLVTRAEGVPATRDNARRMRVQLDEMDRAAAVRATSVEATSAAHE